MKHRNVALPTLGVLLFTLAGFAQTTTSLEGDVKGEDGQPLKGALVKIDREDIKGHYQVKTDKKGHYFHAGLPIGTYKISLEVDGKDVDYIDKVRTTLGDPVVNNFDEHAAAQKRQAMTQAADSGTLTKDQERGLTAEQKAALEKQTKERAQALAKNKGLNDAFNAGMQAMTAKQYDVAVQQFTKASELDPNQNVVWAQLADADIGLAATKTGAEHDDAMNKGLEAFQKALTLKPDDAAYHNNYALALAKAKKFDEAQAELAKAATLDPPSAGKYYYNLGALLVNNGQTEPAGQAFKKAIDADPNYADAQYQYGIYLIAKAQVGADGKITPVDGTREAFEAYLKLKPDGPFAASAKAMLDSMSASLDTKYQNPAATKKKK
jgi:tetratricopeptide (TPR) repeat protein